jgi:hypothetical protein
MRMLLILVSAVLSGCAVRPAPSVDASEQFFSRLQTLCGKAFEGRVAADRPEPSPDFAGKRLVMHVRDCRPDEIRIPFHVGEDRSRTWVVTRTSTGLRLKHDHRHADGTPDALTQYGGDTAAPGSAERQAFPADAESVALFRRENRPASLINLWALEVQPGRAFVYELSRPGGRLFRVEFDLARPVPPPV